MEGLAVGRIVHYRALDYTDRYEGVPVCRAAIVTEVMDPEEGEVQLTVFDPGGCGAPAGVVRHESITKPFDTWHFPERA